MDGDEMMNNTFSTALIKALKYLWARTHQLVKHNINVCYHDLHASLRVG